MTFVNDLRQVGGFEYNDKKANKVTYDSATQIPVGEPGHLRLSNTKPRGWTRLLKIEQHTTPWVNQGI
jgi:hypothetical protein